MTFGAHKKRFGKQGGKNRHGSSDKHAGKGARPFGKPGNPQKFAIKTASPASREMPPTSQNRDNGAALLWGMHAVRAAWLNPQRKILKLWATPSALENFESTRVQARDDLLLKRPDPKKAERIDLDRLTPDGSVHQGIVAEVAPLPEPHLNDLISQDNPPDVLIALDQVTDPHNVGAILRTAAAFGAGAVIMTERHAPSSTGVLAKSASGALEHMPQVHVVNLARAIEEMQQAGYWCIGLAEEGEQDLAAIKLNGKIAIIMGAEGDGLRQLTRKKCDQLARLPTGGPIGSLNVSNAAAVALYEVRRQKIAKA